MYADGSPRYEARETCPDAILYHKVSTLEPHPTGLPVYVVPFMTKYRDKYRYNTFPLQQEGEYDTPYYDKTHPISHVRHVLNLFISSIYVDIDDSNSDLSIITSRFRFLR